MNKELNQVTNLVEQLSCEDLYFLKDREHFHNKKINNKINKKCNF